MSTAWLSLIEPLDVEATGKQVVSRILPGSLRKAHGRLGNPLKNQGFSIGKLTCRMEVFNGKIASKFSDEGFSIAMFEYQRVYLSGIMQRTFHHLE